MVNLHHYCYDANYICHYHLVIPLFYFYVTLLMLHPCTMTALAIKLIYLYFTSKYHVMPYQHVAKIENTVLDGHTFIILLTKPCYIRQTHWGICIHQFLFSPFFLFNFTINYFENLRDGRCARTHVTDKHSPSNFKNTA